MKANSYQVEGSYYSEIQYQPWDFITDIEADFLTGNVIKYLARWERKNGVKDLEKAAHYITKYLELGRYSLDDKCSYWSMLKSTFLMSEPKHARLTKYKHWRRFEVEFQLHAYRNWASNYNANSTVSALRHIKCCEYKDALRVIENLISTNNKIDNYFRG